MSKVDELASVFEGLLLERIAADALELPPLPQAAMRCLELLQKTTFSLPEAAAIISEDPVLALRVLGSATVRHL